MTSHSDIRNEEWDDDAHSETKIPGPILDGIDLTRIATHHPVSALEIARIEAVMGQGEDTEGDLLSLGQLLFDVGEVRQSERLLRCNVVEEGDAAHRLYLGLHGSGAERILEGAVRSFGALFGLLLTERRWSAYLQRACHGEPDARPVLPQTVHDLLTESADREQADAVAPRLAAWLSGPCEVNFTYYDADEIEADISSAAEDRDRPADMPGAEYGLPFVLSGGVWKLKRW